MISYRCTHLLIAVVAIAAPGSALTQTTRGQDAGLLIAVLKGSAAQHEKARACQQLAAIGAREAVPALASLLGDPQLAAYARSGLEAIADPAAGVALRRAAAMLHGTALIGVVNSLGVRRDALAVPALIRLARNEDPGVAAAAASALGRIAAPEALGALGRLLDQGNPGIQTSAADALIAAAERLRVEGKSMQAAQVCERVRRSSVPRHLRLAATGRLVVIRRSAGLPLLEQLLRSADPDAVHTAIAVSHELPGAAVTRLLATAMKAARPETQSWLVQALLDRRDPAVLPAIEAAAASGGAQNRAAALEALGAIGGASSIAVLIKAAGTAPDEAERTSAAASLVRLRAPETDAAILAALPACAPPAKARLIGVLAKRRASGAVEPLLRLAGDPDASISQAAFGALAVLGRPGDMSEILRLTLARQEADSRESGARAYVATCSRSPDIGGRSAALAGACAASKAAPSRALLLRMLSEVGTWGAYQAVKPYLGDPDPSIRLAAVRSLAEWHDATPVAVLLSSAASLKEPEARSLALRGAIRLIGAAAEETSSDAPQLVSWLTQAAGLVGSDVDAKRLLLSAAGNTKSVGGIAVVRPYLADPSVESEAAQALVRIAGQLSGEPRRMAKSVLETLAGQTKNGTIRAQAESAAKQIPGPAIDLIVPARDSVEVDVSKLVFKPLFDGKSFAGWEEGDSGAFRIEDGAIVGGSMKAGLKQNEFLCTTRSYANFVLRAECKLVGPANGGIQIRSQRVPMSSEVCGYQPDMDSSGQYWGCLYDESRRGMLVQADRSVTDKAVKKDDWNAYEIRCEGPRIRLYVNGVLTADYVERDPEIVLSGVIGVQTHAGEPGEAWYHNIVIAELP